MLRLKEGDPVKIVDRNPTNADLKAGLYYAHYRNLIGIVFKLFGNGDQQQVAVDVVLESLPTEVAARHIEFTAGLRATMSAEMKRHERTESTGQFRLRYVVMVHVSDVVRRKP
jgi:hypothetical protein